MNLQPVFLHQKRLAMHLTDGIFSQGLALALTTFTSKAIIYCAQVKYPHLTQPRQMSPQKIGLTLPAPPIKYGFLHFNTVK